MSCSDLGSEVSLHERGHLNISDLPYQTPHSISGGDDCILGEDDCPSSPARPGNLSKEDPHQSSIHQHANYGLDTLQDNHIYTLNKHKISANIL